MTKKPVRVSIDVNLSILNYPKENPKTAHNEIALDFSARLDKN